MLPQEIQIGMQFLEAMPRLLTFLLRIIGENLRNFILKRKSYCLYVMQNAGFSLLRKRSSAKHSKSYIQGPNGAE